MSAGDTSEYIISLEPQKLTKFLIVIEEDDNHN